MSLRTAFCSFLVACFVALVACGGDKGDSCSEEGKVLGECDEGFVCGRKNNNQTGELVCLTQCTSVASCTASEDCFGVANTSLRGCRPR